MQSTAFKGARGILRWVDSFIDFAGRATLVANPSKPIADFTLICITLASLRPLQMSAAVNHIKVEIRRRTKTRSERVLELNGVFPKRTLNKAQSDVQPKPLINQLNPQIFSGGG
jgi:hypothetical protein